MTSYLILTDEEYEQIKKAVTEAFSRRKPPSLYPDKKSLKQSEPDKIKDGFYE